MPNNSNSYRFGPYRLDVEVRRLFQNGQPVKLTPRIFDLLLILVERRAELVTKEELMNRVWPDQFVEENNLTVMVSALRKALGDSHKRPEYIETVARHGYRFVARVKEGPGNEFPTTVDTEETTDVPVQILQPRAVSIAVLPFINESENGRLEYLSDGITESIINHLSRFSGLKVMARTTAFRYKGRADDAVNVGSELGVATVLVGSVTSLGFGVVIKLELVDVVERAQIWGESYTRQFSTILALQEEIAGAVWKRLRSRLPLPEAKQFPNRTTEVTEAFVCYLKGRYFWNRHRREAVYRGIDYFKQAIDIDPNYALAYAGLSDSYQILSNIYLSPKDALPKAKEYALKSVELDDTLPEAHISLGVVKLYYDHDWAGAETSFIRAIELNPGAALAHRRYGSYLTAMGRFEEALAESKLAYDLDPLCFQISINQAFTLFMIGRYDEASGLLNQTLEMDPNSAAAHATFGCILRQKEDYQNALTHFQEFSRLSNRSDLALGFTGQTLALMGNEAGAKSILREMLDQTRENYVSPFSVALVYIGLDDKDSAFEWLEKLVPEVNDWLVWLKVIPELNPLRSDPRFKLLLRAAGFPDAAAKSN